MDKEKVSDGLKKTGAFLAGLAAVIKVITEVLDPTSKK